MINILKQKSIIISLVLLLICITLVQIINRRQEFEILEKRITRLPMTIEPFIGSELVLGDNIIRELDADAFVNRVYIIKRNTDKINVYLYIGYYGTEKDGRTDHNPNACLPSQGWAIIKEKKVPIEVILANKHPEKIKITRLLVKSGPNKKLVYHWYQADGNTIVSSGIQQNINRFLKRIMNKANDGAFVQVSINIPSNSDNDEEKILQMFIQKILPHLKNNWPKEIKS